MRESDLLRGIYQRSAELRAQFRAVLVGPGDDCAVVATGDGPDAPRLLITVDQVVEGRHFAPGTTPNLIARKAVARSISDIAAMGGTPTWALAAGVIPDGFADGDALCEALHRWGAHWGAPVVGGDIAIGARASPLMLSVTVGGALPAGMAPVLRSGARPADEVWVTGCFGGSLEDGGGGRHLMFEPRLTEAAWLREALGDDLHAMIDVSDGLGRDAGRVALASGVRIEIDGAAVPRAPGVVEAQRALADGEDYELIFTVTPGRLPAAGRDTPPGLAPFTRIGRVVEGQGCVAAIDGREFDVSQTGWDHGA